MEPSSTKKYTNETIEEIEWEEYEYDFFEKSSDWFWVMGAIIALLAVIAFMMSNLLLVVILLLGAATGTYYAKRPPQIISFGLMARGVKVGPDLYPYRNIKSFWIDTIQRQLIIETDRWILPHVILPLPEDMFDVARGIMLKKTKEIPYDESIIDLIANYFGF